MPKEDKGRKKIEPSFDSSPNVRHTHGMSDEGDFSRTKSPLKICEIFTPIYCRCGVNLFGIVRSTKKQIHKFRWILRIHRNLFRNRPESHNNIGLFLKIKNKKLMKMKTICLRLKKNIKKDSRKDDNIHNRETICFLNDDFYD